MLIKKSKIPVIAIATIGVLPSFLKKFVHRLKGYTIGRNVSIGFGSVIIGDNVVIGDNVKVGLVTVIRGREIEIKRFVCIGSMSMIDTGKLFIDEDARINEKVIVGGVKTPNSSLTVGKRAIIMEYAFINTTMPIDIGDDSGIGGHCLLFTHGSWLSQLDGFPVTFAPITLGKRVWLPWRVFIMPGVTIGNDVVIGANSLVSKNLPSNILAAGSPAQIIKENYPPKISEQKRDDIVVSIISDFVKYLDYSGIAVSRKDVDDSIFVEVTKKKRRFSMVFVGENMPNTLLPSNVDLLIYGFNDFSNSKYSSKMVINLKDKTRIGSSDLGEEFTKFISRYGVRFDRLD